jgi:lipopolysaccharide export system permease protein
MPLILYRYILQEVSHPFAVSLLAFTSIVFSGRLMQIIQKVVMKGIGLLEIMQACLYLLPFLLMFTLPMAATVGIMLALMRLAADHEIIALKVSGLSYRQLVLPILGFSLLTFAATMILTVYGAPWGRRETQELLSEVVKRRADLGLQEQVFNTDFKGFMIYVNKVAGPDLSGVFVYDSRDRENPQTIYAARGVLSYNVQQDAMILKLSEGLVIRWDKEAGRRHTVDFRNYQLPLTAFQTGSRGNPSEGEMSFAQLRRELKAAAPDSERFQRLAVEMSQRFAMPVGALLLCLVAIPLGLSPVQHGRTWGLVVGLGVFLFYYLVFTASWRLGVNGRLNPFLAPWLVNALFILLTLFFWHRTIRELPLFPSGRAFSRLSLKRLIALGRGH